MKIRINAASVSAVFLAIFLSAQVLLAGSYNVMTHVVVGSNDRATGNPLGKVAERAMREIRSDFDFRTFSTTSRHFQSMGMGGNVSFQSMLRDFGSLETQKNPIFAEWNYGGLFADKESPGLLGFKAFRFEARVPVSFSGLQSKGNQSTFVKYENVRLSMNNVLLKEDTPKVIATLPLPRNDEMLFFILHVKKSSD
ncbi:MAG: hypothetical protein HKN33_10660 [Pyrinomonadaceae bacterium]|nr:hypothetical protein [Pyrinomonadaceae bacterium]